MNNFLSWSVYFIKQDSSSYALRFVSNRLPNLGKCPETNIETNLDLDVSPNEDEIVTNHERTEYLDREPLRRNSTMRQSKRHSDCNVSAISKITFHFETPCTICACRKLA